MRNPVGARDEDIQIALPLRGYNDSCYYISLTSFIKMMKYNKLIQCEIDDQMLYIFDRAHNRYVHVSEHSEEVLIEQDLVFPQQFLEIQEPLMFLIVWKDHAKYVHEQIKLKNDINVLEKEKNQLKHDIYNLAEQIHMLDSMIKRHVIKKQSSIFPVPEQIEQPDELDLAILYSNPIMQYFSTQSSNKGTYRAVPPIGYFDEIKNLRQLLKDKNLRIRYKVSLATKTNLKDIIDMRPKVLQIISHGDYDRKEQKFYLGFEKNGTMDPLYQTDLKVLFQSAQQASFIKLVLISSCHSGELAQIIQNSANIPYVIAVSSELKIEDTASQIFSRNLFSNLALRKNVKESFEAASVAVKGEQGLKCFTCCCAHKHNPRCPFELRRIDAELGFEQMHNEHTPNCNCAYRKEGYHLWGYDNGGEQCEWANGFINNFFEDEPQIIDDIQFIDTEYLTCRENKYYLQVCCCELYKQFVLKEPKDPKDEITHDESMKFKLYSQLNGPVIPFERSRIGQPEEVNPYSVANITIAGRAQELFQIFQFIRNKQADQDGILYVTGESGCGKTELVKQAIAYTKERDTILQQNDPYTCDKLVNLQQIKMKRHLILRIVDTFDLNQDKFLTFDRLIQQFKVGVIAFDHADMIYIHDNHTFVEFLKDLRQQSPELKIIVTVRNETMNKLGCRPKPTNIVRLGELDQNTAAQMFLGYLNNRDNNPVCEKDIDDEQLFSYIKRYPQFLLQVANYQNYHNCTFKSTVKYFQELWNKKQQPITTDDIFKNKIANINQLIQDKAVRILNFLCLQPQGVTIDNLLIEYAEDRNSDTIQMILRALETNDLISVEEDSRNQLKIFKANPNYASSSLFLNRLDIKELCYEVIKHQATIMEHYLAEIKKDYKERLFDYSLFSESSFVALLSKHYGLLKTNSTNIQIGLKLKLYFQIHHQNWQDILLKMEDQFSTNSEQFINHLQRQRQESANNLSEAQIQYELSFDQLFSFIDYICIFIEYATNFFLIIAEHDKSDFNQIIESSKNVLDKTITQLLDPLLEHECFYEQLVDRKDRCYLTIIKILAVVIDSSINELSIYQDEPKQKVSEIKVCLEEISQMERYLSSEQCIQTERTYLNVIKDILPVILDVKSKWRPEELVSDYSDRPEVMKFRREYDQLRKLIVAEEELKSIILHQVPSCEEKQLMVFKICLVRLTIKFAKLVKEAEMVEDFGLIDPSHIKMHLQVLFAKSPGLRAPQSVDRCQYFGDWLQYLWDRSQHMADEEFVMLYEDKRYYFEEHHQLHQQRELKTNIEILDQKLEFNEERQKFLQFYCDLLKIQYLQQIVLNSTEKQSTSQEYITIKNLFFKLKNDLLRVTPAMDQKLVIFQHYPWLRLKYVSVQRDIKQDLELRHAQSSSTLFVKQQYQSDVFPARAASNVQTQHRQMSQQHLI